MIHRRAFLAGLSAAVTGARSAWAQAAPIESFAQWMQASRREREDAVRPVSSGFGHWIRRFKRGSRWRHSRRWATARSRAFRSARRTSWKGAGSRRSTARQFTRAVSAPLTQPSSRRCAAAGRFCSARRIRPRSRTRTPAPTRNPRNLRAHAGRQLQRFGCSRCGRHGAVRARHADARFGSQACIVLWRHRLQAELRPGLGRRRAAVREEPGYSWLFHPHARRHAGTLGGDGPLRPEGDDVR